MLQIIIAGNSKMWMTGCTNFSEPAALHSSAFFPLSCHAFIFYPEMHPPPPHGHERGSVVESSVKERAYVHFHFLLHPGGPPVTGFGSWQECSQHCHIVCCFEFTYLHLASLLCANDCPGLAPILQQLQFFFDGGETCNKKRTREGGKGSGREEWAPCK